MGKRLNWSRARSHRGTLSVRDEFKGGDAADRFLAQHKTKKRRKDRPSAAISDEYYRARGSVVKTASGEWVAVDRDGVVIAECRTRIEAWREADKLGMERAN